jgi:hypothetical protein
MSPTRPQPDQFATRAEYRWRLKLWKRSHGGSLIVTLLIAVFFGALSGSRLVLFGLLAFAVAAHMVARSRP